jgi:hypothetical protein
MSKLSAKRIYVVPDWMPQYFPLFSNTGGNSVEELLHDDSTTPFANVVRYLLIIAVRSQFDLLMALNKQGALPPTATMTNGSKAVSAKENNHGENDFCRRLS